MVQGHSHGVGISGTRSFLAGWGRGIWVCLDICPLLGWISLVPGPFWVVGMPSTRSLLGGGYVLG